MEHKHFFSELPDGYKKIVYLDEPFATDETTAEVFVNTDLCGVDLRGLSCDRKAFGDIYLKIRNGGVRSGNTYEIAAKNDFGYPDGEVVFALRVFSELKLIKQEKSYLVADTTRKAELCDSAIYTAIKKLLERRK